jgi:pyruvate formate lyase activating enzyme
MSLSEKRVGLPKPERSAAGGRLGLVFDVMRFSLHDGPGIRTTVFLKGCPLRCWWCHNPESQRIDPELLYFEDRCTLCGDCLGVCPYGALYTENGVVLTDPELCRASGECVEVCAAEARRMAGRWMSIENLLADLSRDQLFFDQSGGGVTLSGGEPLTQPAFTEQLLAELHARRIHTVLDTSGFANPVLLRRVAPNVDLFHYDLKMMDSEKHEKYTGVKNNLILSNLRLLAELGSAVIVRMPIVPGINDGDADLAAATAFLQELGLKNVDLLPYHRIGGDKYRRLYREYQLPDLVPPSTERMDALAARFTREGFSVRVGGLS